MRQVNARWVGLFIITALVLYVTWLIYQPFINVLLWSVVLTVIAMPIQRRTSRWVRSPNLGALLTLAFVIFLVIVPFALIGSAVLSHAQEGIDATQKMIARLTDPEASHIKWLTSHVDVSRLIEKQNLQEQAKRFAGYIAGFSADILGWTVFAAVQTLLVLFTTYYMLRDGHRLLGAIRTLLPLKPEQADHIFQTIRTTISASLSGTVLIAAIQGILGGIGFWIAGIPAPALWGVAMFFMSLVPVVGSSLIWIPAALFLLADGFSGKALFLVIWGVGVISMVDNILRPVLVGGKTRMHELTVFFSVLGGMKLFGPVGIVIGPIVTGLALGLFRILEEADGERPSQISPAPAPAAPTAPKQPAVAPVELPPSNSWSDHVP